MRPIRAEEVVRLWPAVRAAKLMNTAEEFARFREAGPWRVRVSEAGEGLVLDRWRAHQDLLAIRGLWAAQHRIGDVVREAASVARAQGFTGVLSPLMSLSAVAPYLAAGMVEAERIVALQTDAHSLAETPTAPGIRIRPASGHVDELARLVSIDAACFDEFWRYGRAELTDAADKSELFVAERDGVILGYSTLAVYGASGTLGRLAVDPAMRRRGIARTLVADAASRTVRARATVFTLCTQRENRASRALYASLGFDELPEEFVVAYMGLGD